MLHVLFTRIYISPACSVSDFLKACLCTYLFIPGQAHIALAEAEQSLSSEGRELNIITQNVDGLHVRAGSTNVLELHGSLMKTRCLKCGDVRENKDSPICPALKGRG